MSGYALPAAAAFPAADTFRSALLDGGDALDSSEAFGTGVDGFGVSRGLVSRSESNEGVGRNSLVGGGLSGLREVAGTGVWNHARSGFVRLTSLSICSRISLSRKYVPHFDVAAEFRGCQIHQSLSQQNRRKEEDSK